MIVYDEDGPRLWSAGVRDGDRRYVKQGALAASYYFSFQHLAEKGFDSVSLGLSRAFLNDGVLRYKRKWSQRLVSALPFAIALKVVAETPGCESFLRNNPFIFERAGELCGAVFLTDEGPLTAKEVKRLKREYLYDGLSQLVLFAPHPAVAPDGLELPADVRLELSAAD